MNSADFRYREGGGWLSNGRRFFKSAGFHFGLARLDATAYSGGMATVISEKGDIINVAEAARIIGCTEAHVRLLLDREIIKGQKLHEHAWAVFKTSVVAYAKIPQKTGRPRSRTG